MIDASADILITIHKYENRLIRVFCYRLKLYSTTAPTDRINGQNKGNYSKRALIHARRVAKSQKILKKNKLSWILPKNERWVNFVYLIAPAFVFRRNPGCHNLLLRFIDLGRLKYFSGQLTRSINICWQSELIQLQDCAEWKFKH